MYVINIRILRALIIWTPKLWEAKVRELCQLWVSNILVLMEVANEGKSYYPSQIMPWWYNKDKKSPVDAILDEAAKHNMKIFMSSGWAKDQDDNLLDPAIKNGNSGLWKSWHPFIKPQGLLWLVFTGRRLPVSYFCGACGAVGKYFIREG